MDTAAITPAITILRVLSCDIAHSPFFQIFVHLHDTPYYQQNVRYRVFLPIIFDASPNPSSRPYFNPAQLSSHASCERMSSPSNGYPRAHIYSWYSGQLLEDQSPVRLLFMRIYKFDHILNGFNSAGILVGDGQVKFFAKTIDQEELVHRIGFQILDEAGFRFYPFAIDFQNIHYYRFDIVKSACHAVLQYFWYYMYCNGRLSSVKA